MRTDPLTRRAPRQRAAQASLLVMGVDRPGACAQSARCMMAACSRCQHVGASTGTEAAYTCTVPRYEY